MNMDMIIVIVDILFIIFSILVWLKVANFNNLKIKNHKHLPSKCNEPKEKYNDDYAKRYHNF